MKLNNKGFAVSIILYSMIIVITLILLLIVSIYATNVHNKLTQAEIVKEKISNLKTLTNKIIGANAIIETPVNLTTSSNNNTSETPGLYKYIVTNSGTPTYYFRGNVIRNYVKFAGFNWRIVRINEDKTIRIILDDAINTTAYAFNNSTNTSTIRSYFSNTETNPQIKYTLDNWYNTYIKDKYSNKVMSGEYFCEQSKVVPSSSVFESAHPILYSQYLPDLRCSTDGNGKGTVTSAVGLISYDEVVLAGGYKDKQNTNYYLYKNYAWHTMSPISTTQEWVVNSNGSLGSISISSTARIRPVINLRSNVTATGTGTSSDPYIIN